MTSAPIRPPEAVGHRPPGEVEARTEETHSHTSDDESSPYQDSSGEEEPIYVDPDDAQSIIQPSLSPVATRLSSPKTPAAEKAAALEAAGGLFNIIEQGTSQDLEPSPPPKAPSSRPPQSTSAPTQTRKSRVFSLGQLPSGPLSQQSRLPSPWQAGPKELVVDDDKHHKPALSGVFGNYKHRRSSSGGADALQRLRDALPSISLPSIFSNPSSTRVHEPDSKEDVETGSSSKSTPKASELSRFSGDAKTLERPQYPSHKPELGEPSSAASPRASSTLSVRPRIIRRSTSDESMLYNSLSRASSFGDDNRWNDLRDMKNSRFKAIADSWEKPTFKMPQLPNILPESLKKYPFFEDAMLPATIPEGSTLKDEDLSDFDRALQNLTGDIVVLGGYRGSILRSTQTRRRVWVPVKVGLNIRQVNLEVGLDAEDEENMEETIYPSGMLQNIGPVDISRKLFKRLRECENSRTGKLRVWDFGYDWRLSPHLLSKRLTTFLEGLPSNKNPGKGEGPGALVIAHSLGGLITRHAVNQRPELFSGVIFAGTPQRCVNILGPMRNGDAVMFNEKVLTAQVNFSLRTSFVFLPEDGFCFINKDTGEEYPVDFYDPQQWAKYCWSPCIEQALPARNRTRALSSLRDLKLPTNIRNRGNSIGAMISPSSSGSGTSNNHARNEEVHHDRSLAPQMGTLADSHQPQHDAQRTETNGQSQQSRNMAYLTRTLAEIKQFRAETAHRPKHSQANIYPPLALMYGKDVPTVYAAHVSSREVIPTTQAYDNLLFQSGDGVVLAREAMLPPGYELAKGGRIGTDRGHITMLGDLEAVGKALQAVIRGRQKGIGLGTLERAAENAPQAPQHRHHNHGTMKSATAAAVEATRKNSVGSVGSTRPTLVSSR